MDIETVLSQIASGKFDDSLDKITQAAKDRLSEVRKNKKITDFSVGDRVRFNELDSKYNILTNGTPNNYCSDP